MQRRQTLINRKKAKDLIYLLFVLSNEMKVMRRLLPVFYCSFMHVVEVPTIFKTKTKTETETVKFDWFD